MPDLLLLVLGAWIGVFTAVGTLGLCRMAQLGDRLEPDESLVLDLQTQTLSRAHSLTN